MQFTHPFNKKMKYIRAPLSIAQLWNLCLVCPKHAQCVFFISQCEKQNVQPNFALTKNPKRRGANLLHISTEQLRRDSALSKSFNDRNLRRFYTTCRWRYQPEWISDKTTKETTTRRRRWRPPVKTSAKEKQKMSPWARWGESPNHLPHVLSFKAPTSAFCCMTV